MDSYYSHTRKYKCHDCNGFGIVYGPNITGCTKSLTSIAGCKGEQCDNCHGIHTRFICCQICNGTGIDHSYHDQFSDCFNHLNRQQIIINDVNNNPIILQHLIYGDKDNKTSEIAGIEAYNQSIRTRLRKIEGMA